jgi:hypothetical protein
MAGRASPYFFNPTSFPKRMLQARVERFRHQAQRIQKITLARSIGSHQERQGSEFHGAHGYALVVTQNHTLQENGINHNNLPVDALAPILNFKAFTLQP